MSISVSKQAFEVKQIIKQTIMEEEIKKEDFKKGLQFGTDKEIEVRMFCVAMAERILGASSRVGVMEVAQKIEAYITRGEMPE
jgi:hypothetical protein